MAANVLDFVASVIGSLAWPLVVVTLAGLFQGEMRSILSGFQKRIGHIRRASGPGGTSVEFYDLAEQARDAQAELRSSITEHTPADEQGLQPADELELPYFIDDAKREELVTQSPAAALLVLYVELEAQVQTLLVDTGLAGSNVAVSRPGPSMRMAVQKLTEEKYLPPNFPSVVDPITRARNRVAHGRTPADDYDRAELRELVDICTDLTRSVSALRAADKSGIHPYRDNA